MKTPGSGGSRSITFRVSAYFALVSLLLIAGVGTFLYGALERQLADEHTQFLANDIDAIRSRLAEADSALPLNNNPQWRMAAPIGSRLHISIYDEARAPLVRASALDVPAAALPPPTPIDARVTHSAAWHAPDGKTFQLVSAWATVGAARAPRVLIALALDVSIERRLLAAYRDTLLATLIVALLCSALLGYVAVRHGLKPLRRITRAANDITSTQLHRKLALNDAPAELRELAAAFNAMLERLESSFARLSQFSSDLAHELRTPVNTLLGEAQVALTKGRSAAEYRSVVESSVEELERMSRMIESMLFLANADHAQTVGAFTTFDARRELEKLAEFYQVSADENDMRIRCSGAAQLNADPLLFRRAVGNLLSNAMRYSAAGDEIVLDVREAIDGAIAVSVSNRGPGIPPEHLHKIFDRFYRVEPSRGKISEGAGLGLAIVKSIMHAHGGDVTVTSAPGAITVFTLHFPALPAGAAVP